MHNQLTPNYFQFNLKPNKNDLNTQNTLKTFPK